MHDGPARSEDRESDDTFGVRSGCASLVKWNLEVTLNDLRVETLGHITGFGTSTGAGG
jgi:hypothetical protein